MLGAMLLVGFVDADYKAINCSRAEINIDKSNGYGFVTEELVREEMSNMGYSFTNQLMGEIEVDRIVDKIVLQTENRRDGDDD